MTERALGKLGCAPWIFFVLGDNCAATPGEDDELVHTRMHLREALLELCVS